MGWTSTSNTSEQLRATLSFHTKVGPPSERACRLQRHGRRHVSCADGIIDPLDTGARAHIQSVYGTHTYCSRVQQPTSGLSDQWLPDPVMMVVCTGGGGGLCAEERLAV